MKPKTLKVSLCCYKRKVFVVCIFAWAMQILHWTVEDWKRKYKDIGFILFRLYVYSAFDEDVPCGCSDRFMTPCARVGSFTLVSRREVRGYTRQCQWREHGYWWSPKPVNMLLVLECGLHKPVVVCSHPTVMLLNLGALQTHSSTMTAPKFYRINTFK